MTARISFVSAGSGGLGKSSGARAIAQSLALTGLRVVLVDANPGQQSQRAFLAAPDDAGLERARLEADVTDALVMPGDIDADFALLPGPLEPDAPRLLDGYGEALVRLRDVADIIVVDVDRVDGRVWDDPRSIGGGLMRPFLETGGARLVFRIGQTGSQLDDGLAALDAIGLPDITLAIAQVPAGLRPRRDADWRAMLDGLASFGGSDTWDAASVNMIDAGRAGWPRGEEPDWLRRACVWCGGDERDYRRGDGGWLSGLLHRHRR